jgi:hypothetical protein
VELSTKDRIFSWLDYQMIGLVELRPMVASIVLLKRRLLATDQNWSSLNSQLFVLLEGRKNKYASLGNVLLNSTIVLIC